MADPGFEAEELIPRLGEEFGYPSVGAQMVAADLRACSPLIRAAFWQWWKRGVLDLGLQVEGYTLKRLAEEHGMNPIAAFLTLDWLVKEPEAALASLARGHDRIQLQSE